MVAVWERLFYSVKLNAYQFVGMAGMVLMAVFISVSDVFKPSQHPFLVLPLDQTATSSEL